VSVLRAGLHFLRRRIALKLTLTLVGFVAVTLLVLNSVLSHAIARVARKRERGDMRL